MLRIPPPAAGGQPRQHRGPLQNQHTAQSKQILERAKSRTGNPTGRPRDVEKSFSSTLPNTCLWSSKQRCEERDCKTLTRSEAKMEKLFLQHQKF